MCLAVIDYIYSITFVNNKDIWTIAYCTRVGQARCIHYFRNHQVVKSAKNNPQHLTPHAFIPYGVIMAAVEVALNTPLAEALSNVVQPKLSEVGWSTDGDDSALSEYIILMLVNGKTQEQIASELSNDLLSLAPEDTGATEFASWLFSQVHSLNSQLNGGPPPQQQHFHTAQATDDRGISIRGQGTQNEDPSTGNVEMSDAMDGVQDGAV